MNQGKLEVVKQEMARVNMDILGISELKWTGMGEFNSDDHYIYYCGQESLRRNGVASESKIESKMRSSNAISNDRIISVCLGFVIFGHKRELFASRWQGQCSDSLLGLA